MKKKRSKSARSTSPHRRRYQALLPPHVPNESLSQRAEAYDWGAYLYELQAWMYRWMSQTGIDHWKGPEARMLRGKVVGDNGKPEGHAEGVLWTDDAGDHWVLDNLGDWCSVSPGDTYRGKVLVEVPPEPLPIEQHYVGALRLVRGWVLTDENKLKALANSHIWTAEVQKCDQSPKMGMGSQGFYGFHNWGHAVSELSADVNMMWGTYLAWGRCVRGSMGFRVQYAKIESLIIPPGWPKTQPNLEKAKRVAAEYSVPLYDTETGKKLLLGVVPFRKDQLQ